MERLEKMKPMEPIDVRAAKEMKHFKVKIVDMGNACYTYKKFSSVIQTRNYRAPEVMIRSKYDESADIWSLGCTVYELVTGRLLYRPKKVPGKHGKNQHHLHQISMVIGPCQNTSFLKSGKHSHKHVNPDGSIKNFPPVLTDYKPMYDVLVDKYRLRDLEARGLTDFLSKSMTWDPKDRWTAAQLLDHYWLKMIPNYNTHMSRGELREYKRVNRMECSPSPESGDDSNVDQLSDSGFSENA
jgi:serine/threonine-protein kinase SRPK3